MEFRVPDFANCQKLENIGQTLKDNATYVKGGINAVKFWKQTKAN